MDEGLAALVAGIAGTVGALGGATIGGLAAVRGSRIGAEKGAEALRLQVQDQLLGEQRHWVREQRRQSCASILGAYDGFALKLATLKTLVEINRAEVDLDHFSGLNDDLGTLNAQVQQLKLWGPTNLSDHGHDLAYLAHEAVEAIHAWYVAPRNEESVSAAALARYMQVEQLLVNHYKGFVSLAGTTLRAPEA
ncbi:hypothetical protein AB0L10_07290 [Streptomyces flaveolus]|uniref:hypothetical protein n=1 Tax=Streptomyces flaveolus TaxID=67297 RepID=UPI003440DDA8